MGELGRHQLLFVWSPDPLLSMVAAVGLGAAAGTAIVVDASNRTSSGSGRTLADIAEEGPTLDELSPGRRGLAYLPGGDIEPDDAVGLVGRLLRRWPAAVIRVDGPGWPVATVPVAPLVAGRFAPEAKITHGVWQPTGNSSDPPGPGPVLPRLRPGLVQHLLDGRIPKRSKWVDAWLPVWRMPWE